MGLKEDFLKTTEAKSDQFNAIDFPDGPRAFQIEGVSVNLSQEQPVSIKLVGEDRVWRPCKTTRRILIEIWGDPAGFSGRSIELYCDPTVQYGGKATGGIRITRMSHIKSDRSVLVKKSRTQVATVVIGPLPSATGSGKAQSATSAPDIEYQALARAAAKAGKDAFNAWWVSDEGKAGRDAVRPILDELKAITDAAAPVADDPFDDVPL